MTRALLRLAIRIGCTGLSKCFSLDLRFLLQQTATNAPDHHGKQRTEQHHTHASSPHLHHRSSAGPELRADFSVLSQPVRVRAIFDAHARTAQRECLAIMAPS
jgi:hypothetical protein